jgi:hypothetical protein
LNLRSASAPSAGAAKKSQSKTAEKNDNRYFKGESLGEIFEIALDLLFHLWRDALLEGF